MEDLMEVFKKIQWKIKIPDCQNTTLEVISKTQLRNILVYSMGSSKCWGTRVTKSCYLTVRLQLELTVHI